VSAVLGKDAIVRLVDYTEWANHRILDTASTLSVEDFRRDLRASHGGVRGTLAHSYGAELVWLERFEGAPPSSMPKESEFEDVAALRARWTALEARRRSWLDSLGKDAGDRVVTYRNLKGDPFSSALWPLVQHLANHGSYHRGQVVVLLRQLGVKPPTTDLVAFDRERSAGRV
jgi:uncharacterized damage-inducible protein DinB